MTKASETKYVLVAGIDFSDTSSFALEQALELAAQKPNSELHVIHVAQSFGPMVRLDRPEETQTLQVGEAAEEVRKYVERRLEEFTAKHPGAGLPSVTSHFRVELAGTEIAQLASDLDADMIVVGTHGRRGVRRLLLGSVAEEVVRLAHCPVLVARPKRVDSQVPEIEPACPRCLEMRKETQGKELWCAQHRERHGQRHTYHYVHRNVGSRPNIPLVEPQR